MDIETAYKFYSDSSKLPYNVFDNMWNTNPTYYKIYRAGGKLYVERLAKE